MRNNNDSKYTRRYGHYSETFDKRNDRNQGGRYNRRYDSSRNDFNSSRNDFIRGDEEGYVEPHYRSEEHDRRPTGNYSREDYYKTMYDISNYDAIPRGADYGHISKGMEGYGDKVRHYPLDGDPYSEERTHLRYSMGYNPNYDNPEEGDAYRNFDSRGNHGFRHDPAYGSTNEFRDFGDDKYGENYNRRARDRDDDSNYYR